MGAVEPNDWAENRSGGRASQQPYGALPQEGAEAPSARGGGRLMVFEGGL